ncbi:MAG: endonuclease/exonuclease/phosphatase family protein [Erythrobacter sp.]
MRIASFNVQGLRLRRSDDAAWFDGARDSDAPGDTPGNRARATPIIDAIDRRLTARVLAHLDADIVALQEVFDQASLDHFHDEWLMPAGARPYPYRTCLPGNDGRGLDVAVISRPRPDAIISHASVTPRQLDLPPAQGIKPDAPVFRRDCLEAVFGALTLFICHFKAPYPDAERAWAVRRMEALAVRRIIERRFADCAGALWLVLGDLNEHHGDRSGDEPASAPLGEGFSVDLIARMPPAERWSFRDPASGLYSRPDMMLASPALARQCPDAVPFFLREGMETGLTRFIGERLPGVGPLRPHASDHAPLAIDLPIE